MQEIGGFFIRSLRSGQGTDFGPLIWGWYAATEPLNLINDWGIFILSQWDEAGVLEYSHEVPRDIQL